MTIRFQNKSKLSKIFDHDAKHKKLFECRKIHSGELFLESDNNQNWCLVTLIFCVKFYTFVSTS